MADVPLTHKVFTELQAKEFLEVDQSTGITYDKRIGRPVDVYGGFGLHSTDIPTAVTDSSLGVNAIEAIKKDVALEKDLTEAKKLASSDIFMSNYNDATKGIATSAYSASGSSGQDIYNNLNIVDLNLNEQILNTNGKLSHIDTGQPLDDLKPLSTYVDIVNGKVNAEDISAYVQTLDTEKAATGWSTTSGQGSVTSSMNHADAIKMIKLDEEQKASAVLAQQEKIKNLDANLGTLGHNVDNRAIQSRIDERLANQSAVEKEALAEVTAQLDKEDADFEAGLTTVLGEEKVALEDVTINANLAAEQDALKIESIEETGSTDQYYENKDLEELKQMEVTGIDPDFNIDKEQQAWMDWTNEDDQVEQAVVLMDDKEKESFYSLTQDEQRAAVDYRSYGAVQKMSAEEQAALSDMSTYGEWKEKQKLAKEAEAKRLGNILDAQGEELHGGEREASLYQKRKQILERQAEERHGGDAEGAQLHNLTEIKDKLDEERHGGDAEGAQLHNLTEIKDKLDEERHGGDAEGAEWYDNRIPTDTGFTSVLGKRVQQEKIENFDKNLGTLGGDHLERKIAANDKFQNDRIDDIAAKSDYAAALRKERLEKEKREAAEKLRLEKLKPVGAINHFIASMSSSGGYARPNKYEVVFHLPKMLANNFDARQLTMHCDTVSWPGHDLQTQTVKKASEPGKEYVQSHAFAGTISATFYLDVKHSERFLFEQWQELAVNRYTHKANYYKDYIGSMEMYQLSAEKVVGGKAINRDTIGDYGHGAEGPRNQYTRHEAHSVSERTYGIKVFDVYPATISATEYAYVQAETVQLLTVSFNYREHLPITITDDNKRPIV